MSLKIAVSGLASSIILVTITSILHPLGLVAVANAMLAGGCIAFLVAAIETYKYCSGAE